MSRENMIQADKIQLSEARKILLSLKNWNETWLKNRGWVNEGKGIRFNKQGVIDFVYPTWHSL